MKNAHGYTVVFFDELLVACYPDGGDLEAELDHEYNNGGLRLSPDDVTVHEDMVLTDDPLRREIVYAGHDHGWITDSRGNVYSFVARP